MPKISAATVVEHRQAQHGALLAAAEQVLVDNGVDAVTAGRVTEAAGLGRSTFYEYFSSRDDLLVALARSAFDEWNAELRKMTDAAAPGLDRLRAYIHHTLTMTANGKHQLATALRNVTLSPKSREDIVALHEALAEPINAVLMSLTTPPPALSSAFVQGALGAAMNVVTRGVPADNVSVELSDFITAAVTN